MSYNLELTPATQDVDDDSVRETTVILPIGGFATRARSITQDLIPKQLIRLGSGLTVLDHVTTGLQRAGFRNFVFCLGHHSNQLEDFLKTKEWIVKPDTEYDLSFEEKPLGPDGAALQAIENLGLEGRAMLVPGDMALPWQGLARMCSRHAHDHTDVTVGVTSYVTEHTTDVGRIIAEETTDRLLWCHPRDSEEIPRLARARNLTSAAAAAIAIERYAEICSLYLDTNDEGFRPLSLRDEIMPWYGQQHPDYDIRVFDVDGEILDLGTPDNIRYGQENWERYQ